jgi:hypothetical protein
VKVDKTVERSIDTLQRVYAVIVALAINEAIKRTFLKGGSSDVEIHYEHLPEFIALIATAVPFLHGMNRHLDQTLKVIRDQNKRSLFAILVLDFVVFLAEACILFLLAASVTRDLAFFQLLMVLLLVDVLWVLLTWKITKSVAIRWAIINVAMIAISCMLIYPGGQRCVEFKTYVLAACAVIRTVLDYYLAWGFYFPPEVRDGDDAGVAESAARAAPIVLTAPDAALPPP